MAQLTDALAATVSVITAMGALGTAAFGLVDATKAFGGGVSNVGFASVAKALKPFEPALDRATPDWRTTLRANWINGVAKEDQKTAAKTLIRLGISADIVPTLAAAGHVDAVELARVLAAIQSGAPLTAQDAEVFGRLNAVLDAAMDAGFELGDQRYRNASKLLAGALSVGLANWAGYLLKDTAALGALHPAGGHFGELAVFLWASFVGLVAVPIAPMAKDLASSLQTAAAAVTSLRP